MLAERVRLKVKRESLVKLHCFGAEESVKGVLQTFAESLEVNVFANIDASVVLVVVRMSVFSLSLKAVKIFLNSLSSLFLSTWKRSFAACSFSACS